MTNIRFWLVGISCVALLVFLVVQRAGISGLRGEVATVRLEHDEFVRTRVRRASATLLPTAAHTQTSQVIPSEKFSAAEVTKTAPELPWRNVGSATPEATLQTAMWAASVGDVDALSRLIVFDTKAREIAEIFLAKLPEKSRAEYPAVESLVALMLAHEAPLGGIEVNRRTEVIDGGILLNVTMIGPQGTSKQTDFLFVRGSNGWQFVVKPDLASHFARKLTQPPVDRGESK